MPSQVSLQEGGMGASDTGEEEAKRPQRQIRVMWPPARGCRQPPEAGRSKEQTLPWSFQKE